MTNFDFLLSEPDFSSFASVAVAAENLLHIDRDSSVLSCRRAMEFAIKWMYSVDRELTLPWDDKLATLMNTRQFREIVGEDLLTRMEIIRKMGNNAAHGGRQVSQEQAELCLENLFYFLDFVAYCYAQTYTEREFDKSLLELTAQEAVAFVPGADIDIQSLIDENKALKENLTALRAERQQTYVPKPLDISEYETRKIYIDTMLEDAGWVQGRDWRSEVELPGMPNSSEIGYADYVLYGDDGRALAIIEAKRTCADVGRGRQQAKLYADAIEKQQVRRPVIFLTNGFETHIDDGRYPERKVAAVYSKRDLEKFFVLRSTRTSLRHVTVDRKIAGRYYQEAAIKACCDALAESRRKVLLVMATGSGKTRTVIGLCKVLMEQGWVKNILFLADRNSLVNQAKRSFMNALEDLSLTNLCEEKDNYSARCVFSTYQTMMGCIDSIRDDEGKLFTCGHFDLVICDEAHRSIYNKFRDIFSYFDAPLVGLTATPKDEIDKNTYEIFDLDKGVPTYAYELAQAVKDGFLVDFISVETSLKFLQDGIVYADLTDEEKREFEDTFMDENGELPERISSGALNEWVFNSDTIRQVLNILMTSGLKVDYGNRLGKTIIFARSHAHAEKILEIFNREYPHLPGFAMVIDNYMSYAQSAIDDFSDPGKLPQIAISVDMLDTGIDIPEVLNLVFFKKVMSKAKFWQMIGRGTRLCPGLLDGTDKQKFYIFDFCGNFEFFRMCDSKPTPNTTALQGAIFHLKSQIAFKLQELAFQTPELISFRQSLVADMVRKVQELNRENFAVRQHLKYVELYSSPESYQALTYENTMTMGRELSPLIQPEADDPGALRFDALMYGIELASLAGKSYSRRRSDLLRKVSAIAGIANTPQIAARAELIHQILHTPYLENAGIAEFEHIRRELRDLMKFIPAEHIRYDTNYYDEILSQTWNEASLENDDMKNYRAAAEFYIRQHRGDAVIAKLRGNVPLTPADVKELEKVLWNEIGTEADYHREFGDKPLGVFVREIVGLDMSAAKAAFAQYIDEADLDSRQIYFVNQIIEYIVQNGMLQDLSILQDPPFSNQGSITEVFADLSVWSKIRKAIDRVNANAVAA